MTKPEHARVVAVQAELESLATDAETSPAAVLERLYPLLDEVSDWSNSLAFPWGAQIAAQACRLLDRYEEAIGIARGALRMIPQGPPLLRAHLLLELGWSLREQAKNHEALEALEAAALAFNTSDDRGGQAAALCELVAVRRALGELPSARELAERAVALANEAGDGRLVRRAQRELAVCLRHAGEPRAALELLEHLVLEEPLASHALANAWYELASTLVGVQDYGRAQRGLMRALDGFGVVGDTLGIANAERALASIDALLGRTREAQAHLDHAIDRYKKLEANQALANALIIRAQLTIEEDGAAAERDLQQAEQAYRDAGDRLGLSAVHRVKARLSLAAGNSEAASAAMAESLRVAEEIGSPLAAANALLYQAEYHSARDVRLRSATEAVALYERLELWPGAAQAAASAGELAYAAGDREQAERWMRQGFAAAAAGRRDVLEPQDRADFSRSLASASDRMLSVLAELGSTTGIELAADLTVDSGSIALGEVLRRCRLPNDARDVLAEVEAMGGRRLSALNRLATLLTTIDPQEEPKRVTLRELAGSHNDKILIALGAPTAQLGVPVAVAFPDGRLLFELRPLSSAAVEMIDALGRLNGGLADLALLWDPDALTWQQRLASELFPAPLAALLEDDRPPQLALLVHPSLAHIPFEALRLNGHLLGAIAALSRLPAPVAPDRERRLSAGLGYADPTIDTDAERAALRGDILSRPAPFRRRLGSSQLAWVCCHGDRGTGFDRTLRTRSGERVLDALDLVGRDLSGSAVLLESCWAGRHFGHPHAESLSPATAALVAGAATVFAASFPLPADPRSTGQITAGLLRQLGAGVSAAEALRLARVDYLREAPAKLSFKLGSTKRTIAREAPILHAGLCAFDLTKPPAPVELR